MESVLSELDFYQLPVPLLEEAPPCYSLPGGDVGLDNVQVMQRKMAKYSSTRQVVAYWRTQGYRFAARNRAALDKACQQHLNLGAHFAPGFCTFHGSNVETIQMGRMEYGHVMVQVPWLVAQANWLGLFMQAAAERLTSVLGLHVKVCCKTLVVSATHGLWPSSHDEDN
eukprot:TRINITY_DN639_c0_g1_i18.p2 TRINITY_DN639_c0_g1~~TRINITY_DN639_c0_g1_i18.p2  ORF type:complete len:169 (-),score=46.33 TRINITY_DN639_c0_g1_i18:54-560(-)